MERFGVRRVVAVGAGAGGLGRRRLTTVMTAAWQLWLLWGVAVGVGTGSMALVFGAIVANRWFDRHRGLVTGVFSAANATGQLVFLPVIARARRRTGLARGGRPGGDFATALLVPLVLRGPAGQPGRRRHHAVRRRGPARGSAVRRLRAGGTELRRRSRAAGGPHAQGGRARR